MRALMILALAFIPPVACAGENWPQYRGPLGDGHADAPGLPVQWSETDNVLWKTPIHDKGWSSPVIWGDQVWLTTAREDGKQMFALCVDRATGKIRYDIKVFDVDKPDFCHPLNSYATPTPVIEAGRVYVHFGTYGTACLDTSTGNILWTRRDFSCNHWRGPASSPILYGDLLFLDFDGYDYQYIVALDKKTGKTVWRKDRDINYGTDNGDNKKAYGTPTVVEVNGQPQLISPAAVATTAYDPLTGREIWRVYHGGMNVAARPLFGDGKVFLCSGDGGLKLLAVRPDGHGDVTGSHIVWKSSKGVPSRSSLLLIDGLIYMVNETGIATCIEAATGQPVWQKRIGGQFYASPLYADGHIYFFSDEGVTPVIDAGREYKLLAVNKLDDGFMASPAVAGKALFLRTKTHLYCIQQK